MDAVAWEMSRLFGVSSPSVESSTTPPQKLSVLQKTEVKFNM